jgi:hypothetical protein
MRNEYIARMETDFEILDALPGGHGGARRGAGRKPKTHIKPEAVKDFETARARNESVKADLNELELEIKTKRYLPREAIQQAAATALASLAQGLRSLPDALESSGISPDVCLQVSAAIDHALDDIANDFKMMVDDEIK